MSLKVFTIAWNDLRSNLKGTLIFGGLVALLTWYMTYLFDPTLFANMMELVESYPPEILDMIGGIEAFNMTTLPGYLNVYVFSLSWLYYGIYIMIRVSQDLPSEIENKTIDLYLSKPISRGEYLIGKIVSHMVMLLIVIGLNIAAFWIGVASNSGIESVDSAGIIMTVFGWMYLMLFAIIATAFLLSTFLSAKKSMAIALGVLIIFYFLGTFELKEGMENVKIISIFYYFQPQKLLVLHSTANLLRDMLVLFGYSIILLIIAILIYSKRNIPV